MFIPSHFHLFFFNDTATTEIYTLSLHDALPISLVGEHLLVLADRFEASVQHVGVDVALGVRERRFVVPGVEEDADRKSTRLNSSHPSISYAVFCLKKKKKHHANCKLTELCFTII